MTNKEIKQLIENYRMQGYDDEEISFELEDMGLNSFQVWRFIYG